MNRFARVVVVLCFGVSCSSSTPSNAGSGGRSGSGGSSAASGGSGAGTGGASSASGGSSAGSGGATGSGGGNGSGGAQSSGSGGSSASGGSSSSGGASAGTGGATGSGGATGGASASGSGGTGGSAGGASGVGGGMGGMAVACQAPSTATGTAATVTVDLAATPLATVGPDFMGIHTSVYDGAMQNAGTPDLLKAAGVTSLRYPGGSYGDLYHWATNTATAPRGDTPFIAEGTDFGHFVSLLQKVGANAMITVNYGSNTAGMGPGVPQEAAAWVAYANGMPSSTTMIGMDSTGQDWKTVGYWATLRASDPLAVDDGQNFLRISHPQPVGIKYWEIGNELYGNGYYYGGCGWEPDFHVAYAVPPADCAGRSKNAALSPATYGMGVKAFATAIHAVDPTAKVGAIVHWPYDEYADWNGAALPQACSSIDFVVNHWYAGSSLNNLLVTAHTSIPKMYSDLRIQLTMASNNCGAKGMTMPIAVTEWGPNTLIADIGAALAPPAPGVPTHTQFPGIFAAESYANFMEQGALTVDWLELHNSSYLTPDDTTAWGYHAAYMASALARTGDALLPATVSNAGTLMTALLPHASLRADGSVRVMLTNTSPTVSAAVTVNVTGGSSLACVGTKYLYAPVSMFEDGPVVSEPVFASATGGSVAVTVPPYSIVVVAFPKR